MSCLATAADPPRTQPHWETVAPLRFGVFETAATVTGRHIVVAGGLTQTGQATDLIQIYDAEQDRWSVGAQMPVGRCFQAQARLDDGRVLIVAGRTGEIRNLTKLRDAWIFDPIGNALEQLPDLPDAAGEPTVHRLDDGRFVVIAGNHAHLLDVPKRTWVHSIPLKAYRRCHASVVLPDGRILIVGGVGRQTLELVDLQAGNSRFAPVQLAQATDDLRAVLLKDGRVMVLGGQMTLSGDTTSRTLLVTVPGIGDNPEAWKLEAGPAFDCPAGLADMSLAAGDGWCVIVGGESQRQETDRELQLAWRLDTATGSLTRLSSTSVPHDDAAAVYRAGFVYVIGGYYVQSRLAGLLTYPVATSVVERLAVPPVSTD